MKYTKILFNEYNIIKSHQSKNYLSNNSINILYNFKKNKKSCEFYHNNLKPTPLCSLKNLANEYNLKELIIKDEGKRFNLGSFKGLGVSYAINKLKKEGKLKEVDTLTTMTDGNHGKAVAYIAKDLGYKSIIYVPENMTKSRVNALLDLEATVVYSKSYDSAIDDVMRQSKLNNWCLVSDTSTKDYTEIPMNIMIGYGTIFREIEKQRINKEPITHVLIQAGVGGLASTAAAWLACHNNYRIWSDNVKLIIVEPTDADCIYTNISHYNNNNLYEVPLISSSKNINSIMAGLNCGKPSFISWPIIRDYASYFITIDDKWAKDAMYKLYNENIQAGESGGAGLAGILATRYDKKYNIFDENSRVLLINTENDTDPENYIKIINEYTK